MLAMRQRFAAPAAMRLAAFLFLRCYMAIVPAKNSALIITPSAPLTSDQHAAITSSIRFWASLSSPGGASRSSSR